MTGYVLTIPEQVAEFVARGKLAKRVGRDDGAAWPAYAWPGGYPIGYLTDDGELLCADCVGRPEVHFAGHGDGWRVDAADALYESETGEHCAHCNRELLAPDEVTA